MLKICLKLVITALLAGFFCLLFDYNKYEKGSKTIKKDITGIIFSITAFDGKSESELFLKCLGHTWVSVENLTDHAISINDNEINPGELLTVSVWGISGHFGVAYNIEPQFITECGRYDGRKSLSVSIEESDLEIIGNYIENNPNWTFRKNCSYWSVGLWNEVAGDDYKLKTPLLLYTPSRLCRALGEFDNVEENKDFSRTGNAFIEKNGTTEELVLCY